MVRQLAIIKGGEYGMRDCSSPVLWFSVSWDEAMGALIVLGSTQANELLRKHDVYSVKELNGKPCWIEVDGNSVHFKDLAKL